MFSRFLKLEKNKSYLILGPRQTGKSTLLKAFLGESDLYVNLLLQSEYLKYLKNPERFRQELLSHFKKKGKSICAVDEIQRIPGLLNDIHDLIENTEMNFVLTGSSARNLRAKGVNLLAGRALSRSFFPLVYLELGELFDLERALIYGMLPKLWNEDLEDKADRKDFLDSYVLTYLQEEIQQEASIRTFDVFPRFLDIAAVNDGQLVNFSSIARDCGVSSKTIQSYYQILEDSFLAFRVDGWNKSVRKQLTSQPKYYFFDCGVTNSLSLILKEELNSEERGRRFEQFLVLQMMALNAYKKKNYEFFHWRDRSGTEVDLLVTRNLEVQYAVEFKSSQNISKRDAKALEILRTEHSSVPCYIVGCEGNRREIAEGITYCNWREFLEEIF